MHWLTRISLYRRWLTFLIVALIIGGGIYATLQLKIEMIPDIEIPMTTVVTIYPGASSEEVMNEVTVPVESAIVGIPGLNRISSTSRENMSFVFAEFEYGTKMKEVNKTIQRGLDSLTFPAGVPRVVPQSGDKNPNLIPLNVSMVPLVTFSLSGDMEPTELREIATAKIVPELKGVDGVFSVSVDGGEEKVLVSPDAEEINAHQISMAQIVAVLSSGQYGSLADVGNTAINTTTLVKDVATVSVGPAPGTAITRTNGQNSVGITVMKYPEANTVSAANAVVSKAEQIKDSLIADGNDVQLVTVSDQSTYIKNSVSDLTREAIIGGILAVLVILLFLLTIRGALVIAISIPLSILIGFMVMRAWGLTINILTLSAMAIAVGRIVDDSIVMLEVIYRHLRQGEGFRDAALNGAREIAMPITSATLATVAIFIPLAFVGGIVGEMFVPFALTVTFALLASLLVALTVVPALSSVLVPKQVKPETETWYQRMYTPVLKWSLGHRALTLLIAAVLFFGSLGIVRVIGTSFMSSMGEENVVVSIEMPLGTDVNATSQKAEQVEKVIEEVKNAPDSKMQLYYTTVGASSSFSGALSGAGNNTATIEITFSKGADREKEADNLRGLLEALPGDGTIKVSVGGGGLMGELDPTTFSISVLGEDYTKVVQAADELAEDLKNVDGLSEVQVDATRTVSKPKIAINEENLGFHVSQGLDTSQFQMELYTLMGGAGTGVSLDGKEVFVNGVMQTAQNKEELGGLLLSGGLDYQIKLINVADVGFVDEATQIHRIDGQRSATITATVTKKDVGAVNAAAQKKVNELSDPGITTRQGVLAEEMSKTFRDMSIAIIIAVIISFAIVVVSFRSFISPLIIMFSLPLASVGALLGLLIAGYPLGASAMMGVLMLIGIVLTNAIVLIALVEQLRKKGMSTHDALVQGGRTRLRPILMTALATMFALVPLSLGIGEGVALSSELAVVVIGGLFSSTLLTLVVIPVLYSLTDRFRRKPASKSNSAAQGAS